MAAHDWLDAALARLPGFIRCNSDHTLQAYRMVTLRILRCLPVDPADAGRGDLLRALCTAALQYRGSQTTTMPHRIISVGLRMINTVWGDMHGIIDPAIAPTELRAWCGAHLEQPDAAWLTQNALRSQGPRQDCEAQRDHFTDHEIEAMRAVCRNTRDTLMLELLVTTGIRISALCSIAWRNISLSGRSFQVLEKGQRLRDLHIHSNLHSAFADHWTTGQYVFPSRQGRSHLTARHMRTLFYQLADRAGLVGPHVHPHACRHTVVHRLWYAGNSLAHISRFLGHESPTTTSKYYLRLAHRELISHMIIPWDTLKDRDDEPVDVSTTIASQEPTKSQNAQSHRNTQEEAKRQRNAGRCAHPGCPAV